MISNSDIEAFTEIVERNGRATLEKAITQILDADYDAEEVSSAMKHHVTFLRKVAPVFPAIVNLSYQAVGGAKEDPLGIGAALTLFVEAANIHDDVIDQTQVKHKRKTTYGKYGTNVSILAGDVLLVQAAISLYKECETLPVEKRDRIVKFTFQALIEISKSAGKESKMQRNLEVSPRDYLEVVRLRAAVPEAHCMIGGILGGGSEDIITILGYYGRVYGIVGTVLDEFMDLFDYEKFSSRLSKECLPLPVLCALQDDADREKILPLIENFEANNSNHAEIVRIVMSSKEEKKMREKQAAYADQIVRKINAEVKNKAGKDLSKLIIILRGLLCNIEEFTSRIL